MSDTPPSATTPPARPDLPSAAPVGAGTAPPRRGWRIWLSLAAVLVVVLGVLAAVLISRGSQEYSADDELKFVAACTTKGGEPVRSTCVCIFEQVKVRIPYDRYVQVNADLEARGQSTGPEDLQLPADIDVIRADCVNRAGASSAQPGAFSPTVTATPGSDAPKYSTPETLDNGGVTVPTSSGFAPGASSTTAAR